MQYVNPLSLQGLTVEKFESTIRKAFDGSIKIISLFQRGIDILSHCRKCIRNHEADYFQSKEKFDVLDNSNLDLLLTEGMTDDEAYQIRNWRSFWD